MMDELSIILTIHTIMIALFPLFRRFFNFILSENREAKIINIVLFSIINLALPLSLFIVFLISSFGEIFYSSTTKVLLFGSKNYLFELGFRITPLHILSYSFIFIVISLLSFKTIMNQDKMSYNYLDKISILSTVLILLIFSPNFFQLTLFLLILDVLFLRFIYVSFKNFSTSGSRNLKQLILAFVVGNSFLFSSFGLIIKLSRSFDFNIIFLDITLHYNLTHPFFVIPCCLFLVGIIAKTSLFPFHEWKRKAWNTDISWVFQITFLYISIMMLFFFITPYTTMISVINNGIIWYGAIILLFSSVLTIIIRKTEIILTLLLSFYNGIILFTIGINYYFAAFQQIIVLPFIFSILATYLLSKKDSSEEKHIKKSSILRSIFSSLPFLISALALVGVSPLNNTLVAITYTLDYSTILFGIGLLICGIISTALIIYHISKILYRRFNQLTRISLLDIFLSVGSSLAIILFSILVPYLLPIENLDVIMLSESRLYLKSVLPIAAIGFGFTFLYLLLSTYFKPKHESIIQKTESFSDLVHKVITFDFFFELSALIYLKVILPSGKWIKKRIIKAFLVEIVFHYSYHALLTLIRGLRKIIFEIIIPNTKKAFVKISKLIRSLEGINLRQQLHLAAAFLLVLVTIVIIYHFGGNV